MIPASLHIRTLRLAAVSVFAAASAMYAAEATNDPAAGPTPTNAAPALAKDSAPTNAPAKEAGGEGRGGRRESGPAPEPSTFVRFIGDRNIFDPDRRPRNAGESRRGQERPRNTVTPTLTLVGVLESERGKMAFFDGPASEYRKTVAAGRTVAGFTVAEIRKASVVLRPKEGTEFELVLGKSHRLDGAEPVEAPAGSGSGDTSGGNEAATDAAPPSGASGDAADVLRKLMQKRAQESK